MLFFWRQTCLWMLCLCVSFSTVQLSHAKDVVSPVTLNHSYAGNVSFELAAGSFLSGPVDSCTVSTSATGQLTGNIPTDATILGAHLYWAGSYQPSGKGKLDPDTNITFNGSNFTSIANYQVKSNIGADFYSGKAEPTTFIASEIAKGENVFTLTNMDIYDGGACSDSTLGGWALIVVFEHDSLPFQVTNVFDGLMEVFNSSGTIDLTLNNFTVAPNPSGKHAHITFEGDAARSSNKELLMFDTHLLTDAYNQNNNQFNSSSNINAGTPYSTDTLGVDVDVYDISAFLTPGVTSLTTSYGSGSDTVLLAAEVISLSNIPVADLSVSSTTPISWLANSNVTQKFAITNNGPNDLPATRTNFSTTLPANLTFNGTQSATDWNCIQSGQQLDCSYQNKLRSGWTIYLDLDFVTANAAGTNIDLTVSVSHDNGSGDIFDNIPQNNDQQLIVPLSATAVTDLSASSKRPVTMNGDSLLAGQTLQYIITLDDASNLAVNNISVIDNLPADISGWTLTSPLPSGASNNSTAGQLNLSGINLAAGETIDIEFEVYINADAKKGTSLQNTATITYGSGNPSWIVDTGEITVVEFDLSVSSKLASDLNNGIVLPGDTIRYAINIQDRDGLAISGLQLTDDLPAHIESFSIVSIPTDAIDNSLITGGSNGTGFIDISNINMSIGSTAQIIIDAVIASDAADGISLQNTATLILNGSSWDITSNNIIVNKEVDMSTSGNKPLYLVGSNLTRIMPNNDSTTTINSNSSREWNLTPALQDQLILNNSTIPLNLAIESSQNDTFSIDVQFSYNDGTENIISTATLSSRSYARNSIQNTFINLSIPPTTIPQGATLKLSLLNNSSIANINIHSVNGIYRSQLILDTSTVINIENISVWDKDFSDPSAVTITESQPDTTVYIRSFITDPFGAFDITDAQIMVTKNNGDSYDLGTNTMTWVDNSIDPLASNQKVFEIPLTINEDESITGFWTITITAYEGNESGGKQVTHTLSSNFLVNPFLPNITLTKTVRVLNDPINLTNNPKAIPNSELAYTINAINTGLGKSDDTSIIIEDEISDQAELFIGDLTCVNSDLEFIIAHNTDGPVCLIDGLSPNESGLSMNYIAVDDPNDFVWFAKDDKDFSYQPDSSLEFDADVRYIRIKLNGTFNNQPDGSSNEPKFGLIYKVRLN